MLQQQFWKKVFPTAPIKSGMTYHVRPVPPCPCLQAPCSVVYPPLVACRHPCSVVYPPLGSKLHKGRYIACQCSIKTIRLLPFIYQVYVLLLLYYDKDCSLYWSLTTHITAVRLLHWVRCILSYYYDLLLYFRKVCHRIYEGVLGISSNVFMSINVCLPKWGITKLD